MQNVVGHRHETREIRVCGSCGEDPQDALSLYVVFRKRALRLVALLQKMTYKIRHPMGLGHPVWALCHCHPCRCLSGCNLKWPCPSTCCSVLQWVAVRGSMLQCVAVCCSVLQSCVSRGHVQQHPCRHSEELARCWIYCIYGCIQNIEKDYRADFWECLPGRSWTWP